MKGLYSALMAGAILALLAGCGGSSDETSEPETAADGIFIANGLDGCVSFAYDGGNSSQLCSEGGEYVEGTEGGPGGFSYYFREGEHVEFELAVSAQPEGQHCLFENQETKIMFSELSNLPTVTCKNNEKPSPSPRPTATPTPTPTPTPPLLAADSFFTSLGLIGCVSFDFTFGASGLCSDDGAYTEGIFGSFYYKVHDGQDIDFPITITEQPEGQHCVFENNQSEIQLSELTDLPSVTCNDITLNARFYEPRHNYNARLETRQTISHCLGSVDRSPIMSMTASANTTLNSYSAVMTENTQPAMLIQWLNLATVNDDSLNRLAQLFIEYRANGEDMAIQLGLDMTHFPDPATSYEQDVAAGHYDPQIQLIASTLAELDHPVYLRIGAEFNRADWMGYEPEAYRAAFIRIATVMRAASNDIATVWHGVSERIANNPNNIHDYYPGHDHVDWWALSLFETADFTHPSVSQFFAQALEANKPVMIAEATPLGIGVDDGEADWNAWFEPFFQFVADQPSIKSVCYLNGDWNNSSEVSRDWGNTQIQDNPLILENYRNEWSHAIFQHGASESAIRGMNADYSRQ